jgi:hypothetical protein
MKPLDDDTHTADAAHDPDAPEIDLAPRPRRRAPPTSSLDRAGFIAGILRAGLGVLGLFGSTLYLPVHMATPVLSGVSILMMVTGCTTVWRVTRDEARVRPVARVLAVVCALATVVIVGLTAILGAGAFGPNFRAIAAAQHADDPPSVQFQR